ncbi:hypothetical protein ACS0TY_018565 [Phlomoides rotata]
MASVHNHTNVLSFNPCSYAFFGEENQFVFQGLSDFSDHNFMARVLDTVHMVLDWGIGNKTCADHVERPCKGNSSCVDSDVKLGGYSCRCENEYEGNPYMDPGCTDIDECSHPNLNNCERNCINTPGGYNCSCQQGEFGDGQKNGTRCNPTSSSSQSAITKVALDLEKYISLSDTRLATNSYLPVRSGIRVWGGANYCVRHRKLLSSDRSNKTPVLSPAVATEHRPRRGSEQIAIHYKKEHSLPHPYRASPGVAEQTNVSGKGSS